MPHRLAVIALCLAAVAPAAQAQRTQKPPLHGQEWMAVTGKPLGAAAGAKIFLKGGNAVDAACAMIAATATMWDTLHWGGETQALVYNPHTRKVTGINALGVAPTGATPEFFRSKGMDYPPPYGPLAAVTPGTPGGIIAMLAEYGRLSLAEVLEPAIRMADGYPIEAQSANYIERQRDHLMKWPDSRRVMLPRPGDHAPEAGEIFRQPELAATLRKLVEAEKAALAAGRSRKEAHPGRPRPLLQGRHREGARGERARAGRALHARRTSPAGRCGSRNPSSRATRASTSTSSPPGRRAR